MSPIFAAGAAALLATVTLTVAASPAHSTPMQPQLVMRSHIVLVDDDRDDDDDRRYSRRYRGDNDGWRGFRDGSSGDDDDDDDDDD
jgi:hypothetical protein